MSETRNPWLAKMGWGGGGEIQLGKGVSIQSFSLTHSFSAESFWIQMEGLYYTILLPQFSPILKGGTTLPFL